MPKSNATPSFDPAAVFGSFNMPNFDPAAMFGSFKLPSFDVEALMAAQSRNIEAVTAATTAATDGYKQLAARQAEIVRGAVDEYVSTVRELMSAKDPKVGATKQVEFAKATFEKSVSQTQELTDIATKANAEVFDVLNKRVTESLEEIQAFAKKA